MVEDFYSVSRMRSYARVHNLPNTSVQILNFENIKELHREAGVCTSYTTSHGILIKLDKDVLKEGDLSVVPAHSAENTWLYWSGSLDR